MKHSIIALCLAASAVTAFAADPATSQSMSGSPKPPPKKSATPKKLTPAEERLVEVSNTKAKFMAAMGSCAKPEECDPDSPRKNVDLVNLLKNAEEAFVQACVQCASDKDCEEERAKIRAGRGRYGYNVCYVKGKDAKPADKKSTEKKPASPATTPPK